MTFNWKLVEGKIPKSIMIMIYEENADNIRSLNWSIYKRLVKLYDYQEKYKIPINILKLIEDEIFNEYRRLMRKVILE